MDYIKQIYNSILGYDDSSSGYNPRKIVAFGNVLIDRTAHLPDTELLERFELSLGSKGELDAETLTKITTEACERTQCAVNPGGSALNTVRILSQLGTIATFFGAVGDDKNAELLKEMLTEQRIESRLETISDTPTGQCICLVHKDSNALYANIGASSKFSISHLTEHAKDDADSFLRPIERKQILYIEGFFVPHRQTVCNFIAENYIRERRRLALNLSAPYIVKENGEHIKRLAQSAYFIFGNQEEFDTLMEVMQCSSHEEMAKALLKDGKLVKIIVMTKGADGVLVISNYEAEDCEASNLTFQSYNAPRIDEVVDSTGAGDAFVAGFLHAWLEKRSLSECVRVATDIAAKVCKEIGANLPTEV